MVTLHVAAAGVDDPFLRQTLDADLGVMPEVAADPAIVDALEELGYTRANSNRFERVSETGHELAIDLLTPSYEARMITNQRHGDMIVDAIPGLSLALARPGEELDLTVQVMDDSATHLRVTVPEILAALCVKVRGGPIGQPRRMRSTSGDSFAHTAPVCPNHRASTRLEFKGTRRGSSTATSQSRPAAAPRRRPPCVQSRPRSGPWRSTHSPTGTHRRRDADHFCELEGRGSSPPNRREESCSSSRDVEVQILLGH
jgi:hypothetical protein